MSSDSIHDAVLCAERRARTPARSIDAATVKEPAYGCDCRLANGIYCHNSPHDISLTTDQHRFSPINQESRKPGKKIVLTTAMETAMALLSSCVAWPVLDSAMHPGQATVRLSALRSSSECHSLTENSSKPDAPLV
jgi:hypothetical protein